MKKHVSLHLVLRLAALAAVPSFCVVDYIRMGAFPVDVMCVNIWTALLILMLYPVPHDPVVQSLYFAVPALCVSVALKLLGCPPWAFVAAGCFVLFLYVIAKTRRKFSDVPPLFLIAGVWQGVLDYLQLFHIVAFMMTGAWLCAFAGVVPAMWCLCAVLTMFFVLQYYRAFTRSTMFLSRKIETEIRQGQRSAAYRVPVQYVDSDSRSASLFNDVIRIMETKKPYLQEDFVIDDLSRMTRTNRLYLSKSINFHSGRNFNQLVNYYRVKYAIELIKKDPGLRMVEVAQMSGFHTVVSFNMAFKLNEYTTPSEFARSLIKLT
ncbi:MAG: AraC family transcriptional regulator [Bacteroidales bacterium]|nr:AraC family transcriptional regulator [Bacteroidales bacterium]